MGTILVIDDESEIREILCKLLSNNGYQCFEAYSAEEARDILANQVIQLALVDIGLPGESGLDFVKYVGATSPDTMIIMLTGMDDDKTVNAAMEAGIYAYILKPFAKNQLLLLVQNALRHRQIEIENRLYREQLEEMLAAKITSLRQSQIKLEAITASAYDPIVLVDSQGKINFWNQSAEKVFGYTQAEALGMAFHNLVVEEKSSEGWRDLLLNDDLSGEDPFRNSPIELVVMSKEGRKFPVEISLSQLDLEGSRNTLAIVRDISERKAAEKKLKKTEAAYRRTIEAANEGVAISKNGRPLFVNRKFAQMLGYSDPKELINRDSMLIVHPDDRQRVSEIIALRTKGKKAPERYEFKALKRDGSTVHLEISATQTTYLNDSVTVAFFRDISERKKIQKQREIQHQQLLSIFDSITEIIYVSDPSTYEILFVNRALEKALGKDPVGSLCYSEFQKLDHPCQFCTNAKILKNKGKPYYWDFYNPQINKHFKIVDQIIKWPDGRDVRFEFAVDVSDLKRAEKSLKEAHHKATLLLKAITSILIALDEKDMISEWNVHAEKLFGISNQEATGKKITDLDIGWDSTAIAQAIDSCKTKQQEVYLDDIPLRTNGQQERLLGITVSSIMSDDGTFKGTMIRAADITERRLLERQLAQAQKLEAVGQLAAGIAHEINTPTQFIGDNLQFLTEAFEDMSHLFEQYQDLVELWNSENPVHPFVQKIRQTAEEIDLQFLKEEIPKALEQSLEGVGRVTKIVRAMKEFSHPGAAEKTPIDINHAIENTITVAKNEWKYVADVETDLDPNLPLVPCLPGDLNQVILNLLINSAHAIENVVGREGNGKGKIRVSTKKEDDWVEISISDTGCGVPKSIRHRIFDPFFTTKEVGKGTGQGLSIAHSIIVDKHGGTINFHTKEGQGTTFTIRLPLNEKN